MKHRRIFVQCKKKSLCIMVKENLLSVSWEMSAGVSEEPKEIRCLTPVDVRCEYWIPLPQSCRLINQGNCQRDLICCPEIIICLELSFSHKKQNKHRTLSFYSESFPQAKCFAHVWDLILGHGELSPRWGNASPRGSHYQSPSIAPNEGSAPSPFPFPSPLLSLCLILKKKIQKTPPSLFSIICLLGG